MLTLRLPFPKPRRLPGFAAREREAFSLTELLLVTAITATLMGLAAPALTAFKGAGDLTRAAYDIAGSLESARSYAIARNTYVWVGFFEEGAFSADPGIAGTGEIVVAAVASRDGTKIYDPAGFAALPGDAIVPINRRMKIANIRLKTLPGGSGTGGDFEGRPAVEGGGAQIGDISPGTGSRTPFVAGPYTFSKVIEFNPRGEARVNNESSPLQRVIEIGLQRAHGASADAANANVAAIQVTGVAGNVKIYRR